LVRETESNQWLTTAPVNSGVGISAVLGRGFNVERELFKGDPVHRPVSYVIMLASGSGIAAIRSVIESGIINPPSKRICNIRLYYGARNIQSMAYRDKFHTWKAMGVDIVPVLSQPASGWRLISGTRVGYVQKALIEDGIPNPDESVALMCGHESMLKAVRKFATDEGVQPSRILTNVV